MPNRGKFGWNSGSGEEVEKVMLINRHMDTDKRWLEKLLLSFKLML